MNDLQIFKNQEFGEIRTLEVNDEPWFVGKDVANVLGYKDTSDALKKHVDADDKLTRRFADSGQIRLHRLARIAAQARPGGSGSADSEGPEAAHMKCPYCHRDIHGGYVTVKVDGKYVPAHRDCHPGKTERPPYRQKKPRCRITKALKNYRNDHGG